MASWKYFKSISVRIGAALIDGKAVFAALPLATAIILGGCELSPEQVKFRVPPEQSEKQAAVCEADDCPSSEGSVEH